MVADLLRVVVDTNVLFEGLTRQGGAAGLVIDAWVAGLIRVHVSTALAYEYVDVLGRKLSPVRWRQVSVVLGALLRQAHHTEIHYRWRPISPDPGDDKVIDCAMNAGAVIVTCNLRDFQTAHSALGIPILAPAALVQRLAGLW